MIIISLIALALVPGFMGVASAAPTVGGTCYVDDGSHTNTNTPYTDTTNPCTITLVQGTNTITTTSGADGTWTATITALKWTISVTPPTGYSWTGPATAYSVTPSGQTQVITGKNFWVTKSDPVPVPEFPTIAVSVLTLSGMVIAVRVLKKNN